MPSVRPDDAVARFGADVRQLTGAAPGRIGVAVSGGPDSMALLWLAARAFPGEVEAATVDHGLRPESADEARMVGEWCRAADIPHAALTLPGPITGNVQSNARSARYAALERWRNERSLDWLMTAHHADDQRETILMRLNRGSGVGGLAGVRRRSGGVLRPLLDWRRAELEAVAIEAGVPFVHDPSNIDHRFDRAALRARLEDVDWIDPMAAVRSADALAEADAALDWITDALAAQHVRVEGDGLLLDHTDLPRELLRRALLLMLRRLDPTAPPPRGDTLDDAIARAQSGGKASIGRWLLAGGMHWRLQPAPPRRDTGRPTSMAGTGD